MNGLLPPAATSTSPEMTPSRTAAPESSSFQLSFVPGSRFWISRSCLAISSGAYAIPGWIAIVNDLSAPSEAPLDAPPQPATVVISSPAAAAAMRRRAVRTGVRVRARCMGLLLWRCLRGRRGSAFLHAPLDDGPAFECGEGQVESDADGRDGHESR